MKQITAEWLKELGLESAANKVNATKEFERRCAIAYEHFRFVTQKNIDDFNTKIKKETFKKHANGFSRYDTLQFVNLVSYQEVPPVNVLEKLEEAKGKRCFDSFEVAKIQSVEVRPDPILFGRVKGCPDRFFVSQWDSDVRIEDILKENEG